MEYLLDMWPLLLGLVALGVGSSWFVRRKEGQTDKAHLAALQDLAGALNGTVLPRGQADSWSEPLSPWFRVQTRGLAKLAVRRRPRCDVAVEFTRGPWRVHISEASMRRRTTTGPTRVRTSYEHRIDIATADLPPLKVSHLQYTDFRGRPIDPHRVGALDDSAVAEAPATVAQRQGHWVQAAIPAPANQHLAAFTADHAAAARMLNSQATSWLLDRQHAMPRILTFEAGLLYTTYPGRIDTAEVRQAVDTMLGLLDCVPASAPLPR